MAAPGALRPFRESRFPSCAAIGSALLARRLLRRAFCGLGRRARCYRRLPGGRCSHRHRCLPGERCACRHRCLLGSVVLAVTGACLGALCLPSPLLAWGRCARCHRRLPRDVVPPSPVLASAGLEMHRCNALNFSVLQNGFSRPATFCGGLENSFCKWLIHRRFQ